MTDGFSVTLTLLAGYSNFYSVVSVLICFCIMVVFILRLNGDHFMSSSATHYVTSREQPMTRLHNPFSVRISEGKNTSLKDGLNMDVSVKCASKTEIFWGVNIQAFQKEIHKPVTDIYTGLAEERAFDGNYLHRVDLGIIDETERPSEFFSKCPECVTETSLGSPPRQLYPVVVLSVMEDVSASRETQAIVAQFTIIHLKDSICPLDSHIVYQFVKTNANNLLSLQPIFLSSSEQDFSGLDTASDVNDDDSSSPDRTTETNSSTGFCDKCRLLKYSASSEATSDSNSVCSCHYNSDNNSVELRRKAMESSENSTSESNENTDAGVDNIEEDTVEDGLTEESCNDYDVEEIGDDVGLDHTNTCIICQSAAIYYTLLPCRHACVCVSCVRLVERCPLCRCYINAFFRLYDRDNTGGSVIDESDLQNDIQVPAATIWEALNQRLNEFLGFA